MQAMKHFVFPTVADADAFIADLKAQNVVESVSGTTSYLRRNAVQPAPAVAATPAVSPATTVTQEEVTTQVAEAGGDGKDIAGGALKGGAIGTALGVAAGVAVAATGGLAAIPVILGLGIGAAAGAADGAVHGHGLDDDAVAETGVIDREVVSSTTPRYQDSYTLEDDQYDRLNTEVGTSGRLVAVEDNIPADIAVATATRHNGRQVS